MEIQILASDLDGTLLNEQSQISKETADVIKKAQATGIHFVAVTGRAWNTAYPIFEKVGLDVDYVLLNGAQFRTNLGEIIYEEVIETDLAEKILKYLLESGIDFEVNTDQGDFTTNTKVCALSSKFENPTQIIEQKIFKFFIFSDDTKQMKKMKEYLSLWQGISVTSSSERNVEITSMKANKGNMLKKICQLYHVKEDEVMVFGDGENDETMFREFHHSRAMKNAVLPIQKLAERIIESNIEHGVAKEIGQILGG